MNIPILNRDFTHPADGWYDIEVPGLHPNKRAGIVQVIDDKAVASIVNTFNREADTTPDFAGMLIDHEHFKYYDDKETRAYGWLMRLRNKEGRPQGQIRWSGTGQAAVDKGDYRFFSSEYDPKEMEPVKNEGKTRFVRPLRLDGLSLTNVPNNKGQKPITNRTSMIDIETMTDEEFAEKILNGDFPGHPFHGNQYAEGSSGRSETNKGSSKAHSATRQAMKSGSAEDHASAAVAHHRAAAAANKAGKGELALYHDEMANMHTDQAKNAARAHNRQQSPYGTDAGTDAGNSTPEKMKTVNKKLGLREDASEPEALAAVTKLLNRNSELESSVLDGDLETYRDRYKAEDEEFIRSMLVTNRDSAVAYLKGLPRLATPKAPQRVHNRGAAQDPNQDQRGLESTDAEAEILRRERNEAVEDYKGKNLCTYETAVNMIRNRRPELFGLPRRGE